MNEKSKLFEAFLEEEKITCFEKREIDDEDHTMVYRSYVQTEIGDMPIFVLLDDTIYGVLRLVVGSGLVTSANKEAIRAFIDKENSNYKSFKYYIEETDNTVYLDCIHMSSNSCFEPPLIYVLMNQIVQYIPTVVTTWKELFGVDQLPDPFAAHEHHHEHTDEHHHES